MITCTPSLRQAFTQTELRLALKLIYLFQKYPEVDWNCRTLAEKWECCERIVQRLFAKLRHFNLIEEIRYRYKQCVRKATPALMDLKEKLLSLCRIRAGSVQKTQRVKTDTEVLEDKGFAKHEKTPTYNNHNDNKDPSLNKAGGAQCAKKEIAPEVINEILEDCRKVDWISCLTDQEIKKALANVGINSFSDSINELHASMSRPRNPFKPFSLRGLLINKFNLPRRWFS